VGFPAARDGALADPERSSARTAPGPGVSPRRGFAALARVNSWAAGAFWLAALGFAVLAVWLAVVDRSGGGFDSLQNLAVARNIVEGRGFTSWAVTQHTIPVTLPGPELVRPPGAPYLAALAFAFGGARPGAALLLSALLVLVAAFALRAAIRLAGGGWLGDACGLLLLLAHRDYELVSFWNNGLLTALTGGGVLLAVAVARGRIRGVPLAVGCALLGAAGFLAKPTFLLGALPFAVVLLTRGPRARREPQLGRVLLCLALFAALTAPYWLRNLLLLGHPLLLAAPRLAIRYELPSRWQAVAVVSAHPLSYQDVAARIGWNGILATELLHVRATLTGLLRLGPLVAAGALLALPFLRARDRWLAVAAGALAAPSLFDCVYLHPEDRYLWPVLPVLLLLVVLGILGATQRAAGGRRGAGLARRARVALLGLLAASLPLAVPQAINGFGDDFDEATTDPPDWQPVVAGLPADARVLTWDAPAVAWYARRKAVIVPLGEPNAVARVLAYYRPTHVLLEEDWFPSAVAAAAQSFKDRSVPLARGEDWALYRIEARPASPARPAPPRGR
jgi:hypothetical protein